MSNTFGNNILELLPEDLLIAERDSGRNDGFAQLDRLNALLVRASLDGIRIATLRRMGVTSKLELPTLSEEDTYRTRASFLLSSQQSRGAWFLPEQISIRVGNANYPYHFALHPRFASGAARDEADRVSLIDDPVAMYFWAVLEPLFETLYRPFTLRSTDMPKGDRDEQRRIWDSVEDTYRALRMDVATAMSPFRYGAGWSRLSTDQKLSCKATLVNSMRISANDKTATLYRLHLIKALAGRYYSKSKRAAPTMRSVLTKPFHRVLSAFFEGDWLTFLRYIGEEPDTEELIPTRLPEPKLFVDIGEQKDAVAAKHRIEPAEIDRMLAAFWEDGGKASPVERRVNVIQQYWQCFDAIHSRQAPGMNSLWGLVEDSDGSHLTALDGGGPDWYFPGSYRHLLPVKLLSEIDELWSGAFLSQRPDRIVSLPNPYAALCSAFGPALSFWHGAALTTWFVSEGPYSRTDMAGLAEYYARDLAEIAGLGCEIDRQLFQDLVAAEKQLGDPIAIADPSHEKHYSGLGLSISTSLTIGSRREGFQLLRDVITRHRRAWADRYLDDYLRALSHGQIRTAFREYSRLHAHKGRPPTPTQFARHALATTKSWFGGNMSLLYASFGEKFPESVVRSRRLPAEAETFVSRTLRALGGKPTSWNELAKTIVGHDRTRQDAEWQAHRDRCALASMAIRFTQLFEALDRPPTLQEFANQRFTRASQVISEDLASAWEHYSKLIEEILSESNA